MLLSTIFCPGIALIPSRHPVGNQTGFFAIHGQAPGNGRLRVGSVGLCQNFVQTESLVLSGERKPYLIVFLLRPRPLGGFRLQLAKAARRAEQIRKAEKILILRQRADTGQRVDQLQTAAVFGQQLVALGAQIGGVVLFRAAVTVEFRLFGVCGAAVAVLVLVGQLVAGLTAAHLGGQTVIAVAGSTVFRGVKLLVFQQAAQQQINICGILVAVNALRHLRGGLFEPLPGLGQIEKLFCHCLFCQRQQGIGVAVVGGLHQLGQAHPFHGPGFLRRLGSRSSIGIVQRIQLLLCLFTAGVGGTL